MDDFFDSFVSTVKDTANYVGKKLENGVDVTKLQVAINKAEAKLDKLYLELGEFIYSNKSALTDEKNLEYISGMYTKIDAGIAEVNSLKEKYCAVAGYEVCKKCGARMKKKFEFCPWCGTKNDGEETKS